MEGLKSQYITHLICMLPPLRPDHIDPCTERPESLKEMGVLDLGKAAKLLTDIALVGQEADLSGVNAISAESEFLSVTRQGVRAQAQVQSFTHKWSHMLLIM